jgi:hypothetical protein
VATSFCGRGGGRTVRLPFAPLAEKEDRRREEEEPGEDEDPDP